MGLLACRAYPVLRTYPKNFPNNPMDALGRCCKLKTPLLAKADGNRIEYYQGGRMRTTQQLSITLPLEMGNAIKAKVEAGEYASESEVIREGIRALLARDKAIDNWLRQEVAAAYDALQEDSGKGISANDMRARLEDAYLADAAYGRFKASGKKAIPLDDVMKEYSLKS